MIFIKRAYEPADSKDGYRVLVDRLWPRGLGKNKAKVDLWLKEIAPSGELRKWFGHREEKWLEFRKGYRKELKAKEDLLERLWALSQKHKKLTLLYGAKDEKHNQAVVIAEVLKRRKTD